MQQHQKKLSEHLTVRRRKLLLCSTSVQRSENCPVSVRQSVGGRRQTQNPQNMLHDFGHQITMGKESAGKWSEKESKGRARERQTAERGTRGQTWSRTQLLRGPISPISGFSQNKI